MAGGGMMRWRVGARTLPLLPALWRNSCAVMRSPEALRRPEKTTPESRSAKARESVVVVAVDGGVKGVVEERRAETGARCSPSRRVRRGREAREEDADEFCMCRGGGRTVTVRLRKREGLRMVDSRNLYRIRSTEQTLTLQGERRPSSRSHVARSYSAQSS
ncbi:hypothetical protein F5148DRAFT_1167045 [Russula earlei]|uniref:Uncharacterized protein n=1 Tax=Russula earlei TaxID=71964 RepID=A0ACC0UJQ3_9AGAM|nr:hypothetical protein F5148DRAFT_1167045 [Russula earlei]